MRPIARNDTLLFRGGFAYTRAVFREGPFAGNDIPLVSRYTANAGVSWNIWQKYLVADATVRYWSSRRMDNDQPNVQPLIPPNATVDFKLSGAYDRYFWSLSVNNVFNALYYDYAIASAFTPGAFSAYPLPGPDLHVEGRRDVLIESPLRARSASGRARRPCIHHDCRIRREKPAFRAEYGPKLPSAGKMHGRTERAGRRPTMRAR